MLKNKQNKDQAKLAIMYPLFRWVSMNCVLTSREKNAEKYSTVNVDQNKQELNYTAFPILTG